MSAKPTFQREIAATQSAGAAIFDMLAVLSGLDNLCLQETDKPALGSRDLCFEKEHRKIVVRLGGARKRNHSLPLLQEAWHLAGGVLRSKGRAPSLPGESFSSALVLPNGSGPSKNEDGTVHLKSI